MTNPVVNLGRRIGRTVPGVYFFRHVFTPLDRLVLKLTKGRRGLAGKGIPQLTLTTTGRRSGRTISNPVLYLRDEDRYVIVGSNYGRERHPAWTYNLTADPNAAVQIGEERREVVARRATPEEVERYWPQLTRIWPGWHTYRRMTPREFRMFVLEPRR